MSSPAKIGAHHVLMGLTMVTFAAGATFFGGRMINASSDDGRAAKRDAFVVQCKDKYIERLTSCLSDATVHSSIRRCLEGYWKETNACVVYLMQKSRTGSGSAVDKPKSSEKPRPAKTGSGSAVKPSNKPTFSPKPTSAASQEDKQRPPFRNTAPKAGETPRPLPTHDGEEEI